MMMNHPQESDKMFLKVFSEVRLPTECQEHHRHHLPHRRMEEEVEFHTITHRPINLHNHCLIHRPINMHHNCLRTCNVQCHLNA